LEATGASSRHDARTRGKHRTDREAIRDRIADRGADCQADCEAERGAIERTQAISDARSERGAVADARTDLRTCGSDARDRIEDGEPLDSDVRSDVRRGFDALGFAESDGSASAITVDDT
jgi:hypothetical protein